MIEDLHLTLIGVSRMSKGKPFAIIQDQRGEQAVYQVGETIPDSGKLLEVETDRAVVEHDGRKVIVELPQDEISGAPEPPASRYGGSVRAAGAGDRSRRGGSISRFFY